MTGKQKTPYRRFASYGAGRRQMTGKQKTPYRRFASYGAGRRQRAEDRKKRLLRLCLAMTGLSLLRAPKGRGNSSRPIREILSNEVKGRSSLTGFTLIELLISITLVSLTGMTIYFVFANGITAWKRGTENKTYARNVRITMEKIDRDLKNVFKFSGIAFEGTEESMKFAGLVLSKPDSSVNDTGSRYELGRIAYFYNKRDHALCKEEKSYPQALKEKKIGKGEELIKNVHKLTFEYCYLDNASGDYKWKDNWKKEEQESIPQAVKIKMVLDKNTHQGSFEKTVFIPIGTGEQKIEIGK